MAKEKNGNGDSPNTSFSARYAESETRITRLQVALKAAVAERSALVEQMAVKLTESGKKHFKTQDGQLLIPRKRTNKKTGEVVWYFRSPGAPDDALDLDG